MGSKRKVSSRRHTFRFRAVNVITGKTTEIRIPTKMIFGSKTINLTLTAGDAEESIDYEGYGSTTTCVMSVCVKNQADKFPHHVDGYIDWTYNRAYVVSKLDSKTGQPSECYVYSHHDEIAKHFDKDKETGLLQLWKDLRDNGPREVVLHPCSSTKGLYKRRGYDKKRKARDANRDRNTPHKFQPRGAAYRYGVFTDQLLPAFKKK